MLNKITRPTQPSLARVWAELDNIEMTFTLIVNIQLAGENVQNIENNRKCKLNIQKESEKKFYFLTEPFQNKIVPG